MNKEANLRKNVQIDSFCVINEKTKTEDDFWKHRGY